MPNGDWFRSEYRAENKPLNLRKICGDYFAINSGTQLPTLDLEQTQPSHLR